jgi:hypothetical protein
MYITKTKTIASKTLSYISQGDNKKEKSQSLIIIFRMKPPVKFCKKEKKMF